MLLAILGGFQALRTHVNRLLAEIRQLKSETGIPDMGLLKSEEARALIDEFNRLLSEAQNYLKIQVCGPLYYPGVTKIEATLTSLAIRCDQLIAYIGSSLSPEDSEKLNIIRGQLEHLKGIVHLNLIQNLNEATTECESGHFLASTLITARVIAYILSKIPGKRIEDKIEFLRDNGILPKDREDLKEFILKAEKKQRDYLSHDIHVFPKVSDALGMLSDALKLIDEIYSRLKTESEKR